MKRFIFALLTVTLIVSSQIADAGDIFIRQGPKPVPSAPVEQPIAPEAPPTPEPTLEAQKPIMSVAEFAGQYYKECTAKEDAVLNGANLQSQCACTSQKIVEQLSLDEVNVMNAQTQEGEFQRNRVLLQAYAPCMSYPVRVILAERCVNDKNIQTTVKTYQSACACMGEKMASYVSLNGASIIAKTLKSPDATASPVSALLRDPEFQKLAQSSLAECIKNVPADHLKPMPPEQMPPTDPGYGTKPLPPGTEAPGSPQGQKSPLEPGIMGNPRPPQ